LPRSNSVGNDNNSLPIPDITILRLNYWLEDAYDPMILQAFRNS